MPKFIIERNIAGAGVVAGAGRNRTGGRSPTIAFAEPHKIGFRIANTFNWIVKLPQNRHPESL
jgi:hypothetical protein